MPGSRRSPIPLRLRAAWVGPDADRRRRRGVARASPGSPAAADRGGPARAYAQFPPEHEAAWTNGDLTGGYGASTAPAESGRRYAHGFVDARHSQPDHPAARGGGCAHTRERHGARPLRAERRALCADRLGGVPLDRRRPLDAGPPVCRRRRGGVGGRVSGRGAAVPHAFVAVGSGPGDGPYWTFDGEAWTEHPGELAAHQLPCWRPATAARTLHGPHGGGRGSRSRGAWRGAPARHDGQRRLGARGGRRAVRWPAAGPAQTASTGAPRRSRSSFWSGASWTAVSDLADGASVSGAALGRAGEISFREPAAWRPSRIGGVRAYWLRFSATSVLDSGARLHSIAARQPRKADRFLVVGHELLRASSETRSPRLSRSADGGPVATWTPGVPVGDGVQPGHEPACAGRRALRGQVGRAVPRASIRRRGACAAAAASVRLTQTRGRRGRRRVARSALAAVPVRAVSLHAGRVRAGRSGNAAGQRLAGVRTRHGLRRRRPLPVRRGCAAIGASPT